MAARTQYQPVNRMLAWVRHRSRLLIRVALALALLAGGLVTAVAAQAATDYTQGVTALSATQAQIWFTPTVPSTLVDVHYTFPGQSQQDFRMTLSGGTWRQTILQSLSQGTVVTYWFTFNKNGANQQDTPKFTYTHGGTTNQVAAPQFSPPGGTYTSAQTVTITTATTGATIHYTTNGTTPTATSPAYTGPVTISATSTLQAIATKTGLTNSTVTTATYTIGTGGDGGGSCSTADYTCSVTGISATQAKVSFKPTVTSTLVDLHFTISGLEQDFRMTNNAGTWEWTIGNLSSGTVVTYWFTYNKNGANQGDTPKYTYTHGGGGGGGGGGGTQVATPVLSAPPGTYNGGVIVNITTTTAGAVIHYALGGATPTAASPTYTAPISLTANQTVKAMAVKSGLTDSGVAGGAYTLNTGAVCGTNCGGAVAGSFPLILANNTGGTWANDQIYFTVIGQMADGVWAYLKTNGSWTHINHLDAAAPNHISKNGVDYPNMSFTLAQASRINMPTWTRGGRIYMSIGAPVYIPISQDDQGWGGPDLRNPNDPNIDVYYDWYEYTYIYNDVPFGGNTTQVDQFSFPMTSRLIQTSSGFDTTLGMTGSRAQMFSGYQASVSAPYKGLANQFRIVAPRTSNDFQPGGVQGNLMQTYIDQVWAKFTAQPWTEVHDGRTYTGQVVNGVLTGHKDDGTPFQIAKPNSTQVFECSGPLALGNLQGGSDVIREVGRDFCAAFHRGVALTPADWYNPAKYYATSPHDDYSAYLHTISVNNKAYAFAYDDVNNQSSVQILGPKTPPTSLTLTIGW
jgi:hypothetical protein